mmetsp:Transcript_78609/g.168461  ORF Transcript_78609/g.168461 Transcript_78609/m.168461 type:complete len:245 (+) Transcript_78609:225-959(+)
MEAAPLGELRELKDGGEHHLHHLEHEAGEDPTAHATVGPMLGSGRTEMHRIGDNQDRRYQPVTARGQVCEDVGQQGQRMRDARLHVHTLVIGEAFRVLDDLVDVHAAHTTQQLRLRLRHHSQCGTCTILSWRNARLVRDYCKLRTCGPSPRAGDGRGWRHSTGQVRGVLALLGTTRHRRRWRWQGGGPGNGAKRCRGTLWRSGRLRKCSPRCGGCGSKSRSCPRHFGQPWLRGSLWQRRRRLRR